MQVHDFGNVTGIRVALGDRYVEPTLAVMRYCQIDIHAGLISIEVRSQRFGGRGVIGVRHVKGEPVGENANRPGQGEVAPGECLLIDAQLMKSPGAEIQSL